MNKKKTRRAFVAAILLLAAFVVFTVLVRFVDVQAIGPQDSKVGFAALNGSVHAALGTSDFWYTLTKLLGYASIAVAGAFGVWTLLQMIRRGGVLRANPRLLVLMLLYVAVLCCYVLFEKVVINYRPVLEEEGVLEASYPSSHTLLTLCILGSGAMVLPHLWRRPGMKTVCGIVAAVGMCVMVVGRLLSGVHWLTDILGSCLLSAALIEFYNGAAGLAARKLRKKRAHGKKQ